MKKSMSRPASMMTLPPTNHTPTIPLEAKRPSARVALKPLDHPDTVCSATHVVSTNSQGRQKQPAETHVKAGGGYWENQLLEKVIEGDVQKVNSMCEQHPNLLKSDWAGGVAATSILYAAKNGHLGMIKFLYKTMGAAALQVKDVRGRSAVDYARNAGLDLEAFLSEVDKNTESFGWRN
eukprot:GEMP01072721.1.p1 GENE.GEMP01072721.1~~GEMP01072721.1.p1  ORF type:complete len:179 (+),score=34.89 GEMP01072721.1:314-850(+)